MLQGKTKNFICTSDNFVEKIDDQIKKARRNRRPQVPIERLKYDLLVGIIASL